MVRWDLGPLEKTKSFPLSYGGPPNNIVIDVVITQMISYVSYFKSLPAWFSATDLAKFRNNLANFHCWKWSNMKKIIYTSGHTDFTFTQIRA